MSKREWKGSTNLLAIAAMCSYYPAPQHTHTHFFGGYLHTRNIP